MGLPRLILLGIMIGLGMWLWRRFNSRSAPPAKPAVSQSMVRCAHCHLHLPEDRAIQKNQQWYCSAEHLEHGHNARD